MYEKLSEKVRRNEERNIVAKRNNEMAENSEK